MKRSLYFFVFLICANVFSQTGLYVYKTEGEVRNQKNTLLKKGDEIAGNTSVVLKPDASLVCIDKNGNSYIIKKKGAYTFSQILKNRKSRNSSITVSYLKYVWSQLTGNIETKTMIGGVFRGNQLMLFPPDSSQVTVKNLYLKWEKENEDHPLYLFIKKENDPDFTSIKTDRTSLFLADLLDVQEGQDYVWTFSKKAYPDFRDLQYFHFKTLSEKDFTAELKEYQPFLDDLKKMKIPDEEILEILCERFKYCRND